MASPVVEDQAKLLEDALSIVRHQTHMMRKCLETPGKLMDALKCRQVPSHEKVPEICKKTTAYHGAQFYPCLRASNEQPRTEAILRALHVSI